MNDLDFQHELRTRLSRIEDKIDGVSTQQRGIGKRMVPLERFYLRIGLAAAFIASVIVTFAQPLLNWLLF